MMNLDELNNVFKAGFHNLKYFSPFEKLQRVCKKLQGMQIGVCKLWYWTIGSTQIKKNDSLGVFKKGKRRYADKKG